MQVDRSCLAPCFSLSHTHAHTQTLSFSLLYIHTLALSLAHSHSSCARIPACSVSHLCPSLSLYHSILLPHSRARALFLSRCARIPEYSKRHTQASQSFALSFCSLFCSQCSLFCFALSFALNALSFALNSISIFCSLSLAISCSLLRARLHSPDI